MAGALVNAAAAAAINAVVLANDAVENGAHGPLVITTMMAPPRGLVRVFSFDFGHFQLPGLAALNHLEAARPYFEDLLNSHLPFNVGIEITFSVFLDGEHHEHYITVPPVACMDAFGGSRDWHSFLEHLQTQAQQRVENAEGLASAPDFVAILRVKLTFAPLRDLAALGPHVAQGQACLL